ncbi:hypothetical protein CLOP_g1025 [Closterium sp. NIES-67]|nr:hypothetical protein CLOP_g1025 [Closterium sp. NIES-67]
MGARADEARSELLRVRRDIQMVEEQLARATHELDEAAKAGDRERVDDHRRMRNCLWKEKEQLRIQETIFLKIAFADFAPPNMMASPGSHAFSSPALPSPLHLQHQAQMLPHAAHLGPPPFNNPPLAASSLSGSPALMGACDPAMTPLHTGALMPATSPPDCFSLGGPSPSPLQTPLSGPGGAMGMGAQGAGGHLAAAGMSAGQSLLGMLPTSPAMRPAAGTPASGGGRNGRRRGVMSPGLAPMQGGAMLMGGDMAEMANPEGYEVSRNLDARVEDVWREWKDGLNGGPSIEKLEEARRRDRKCVWWRHKNDYKYWRKQMRIVHAVESKAGEFAGDVAAAIRFWDDILRVEFAGSISKLREALGGDRPLPSAQSSGAGAGGNGVDDSPGAEGRGEDGREGALMAVTPVAVGGVCAEAGMGGGMGNGIVAEAGPLTGALVDAMGTPVGMQAGMGQQGQVNVATGVNGVGAHVVSGHDVGVVQGAVMQHGGADGPGGQHRQSAMVQQM